MEGRASSSFFSPAALNAWKCLGRIGLGLSSLYPPKLRVGIELEMSVLTLEEAVACPKREVLHITSKRSSGLKFVSYAAEKQLP